MKIRIGRFAIIAEIKGSDKFVFDVYFGLISKEYYKKMVITKKK